MSDKSDFFNDDSLLPDWMRGAEPEQPDEGASVPGWGAPQAVSPPWQRSPGEPPPRPSPLSPAPPPWEQFAGPHVLPPLPRAAVPPWGEEPAVAGYEVEPWAQELPVEPVPGPEEEPGGQFDWSFLSRGEPSAASPASELPRGMTADLPWREEATPSTPSEPTGEVRLPIWTRQPPTEPERAFTMSDLLNEFESEPPTAPPPAEQPSLRARLLSLSPKPEPTPPGADETWLPEPDFDALVPELPDEEVPGWLGIPPLDEQESAGEDDLADWLMANLGEPGEPPAPEPPTAPPSGTIRRIGPAAPEPPAESAALGAIRRLPPAAQQPPAAPPPPPEEAFPAWLEEPAAEAPGDFGAPADVSGMTYEEWERLQFEREQEEQKTPEDRLLEQVPDWFSQIEKTPPPPPAAEEAPARPGGPEFVPDWFLGLEEQDTAEAPDWFQSLDLSADALAEPLSAPSPPPLPPAPETAADVPDWFAGLEAPALGELDWEATFGAPSAPEAAPEKAPDWLTQPEMPGMDDLLGQIPMPEAAPEEAPDWLTQPEMPGMGDLLEEAPAPGKVPGWLDVARPGTDVMAQPEDIPFPDLELDQVMPLAEYGLPAPEEAPSEEGFEAWMADFAPTAPGAMPPPTARPSPPPQDFVERFEPIEPEPMLAPLDEEAPAWLRDFDEAEEVPSFAGGPAGPGGPARDVTDTEGLDWLAGLSAEDLAPPLEPEKPLPAAPPTPETVPVAEQPLDSGAIDQLLGLYTPDEMPAAELPGAAWPEEATWAVSPGEELLRERVSPVPTAWAGDMAGPDLDSLFAESGAGELFPDMTEMLPEQELPAETAPLEPAAPAEARPEWIAELRPTDLPVTVKAGGAEAAIPQKQVAELPPRLQALRQAAIQAAAPPQAAPAPASGALAGIENALPLAEVVLSFEQRATPSTAGLVITPEQQVRVNRLQALLETVAAEEEEADQVAADAEQPAVRTRRRSRLKPDRLVVTLLLLVALVVPFANDALHFAADPPPLAGARAAVGAAIDRVGAGEYVLFAFEYGPAAAGELDPLAEAVLRDTLAHWAIPLTLGTNPAGAFHAQAVLAPLNQDRALLAARGQGEEALQAGEDYVNLAYLPGEAVGVRTLRHTSTDAAGNLVQLPAFAADLRGDDTGLVVGSLERDIALIVVVGETSDDIRTWAEQLDGVNVPKVALVTAALEPLTTPYVHQDGYAGYLAGVRDTYAYNMARNAITRTPYMLPGDLKAEIPNPEVSRWHSMALGAAVAAGLIALGLVVNLFRALVRRGRR